MRGSLLPEPTGMNGSWYGIQRDREGSMVVAAVAIRSQSSQHNNRTVLLFYSFQEVIARYLFYVPIAFCVRAKRTFLECVEMSMVFTLENVSHASRKKVCKQK